MFTIEADNTINITRGDILFFGVGAKGTVSGEDYIFQPGDIVRMTVNGKKDCENVVLNKDFLVETPTEEVVIYLDSKETKIGEPINSPEEYWYEIVLNPDTAPQTIIGYDDVEGAKIFRLYPEAEGSTEDDEIIPPEEIPFIDSELDPDSKRPIENQAVARAILSLLGEIEKLSQEIAILKNTDKGEAI